MLNDLVKFKIKNTMKTYIYKVLSVLFISSLLFSCSSDKMEFKDSYITPVENLYEPADSKTIQLTSNGTLYFSWQAARSQDAGAPLYEVFFDVLEGDFSKPIYSVTSDLNGFSNGAEISFKILNKIATNAGAEPGEAATVKWTVVSSRGINPQIAKDSRTLTITRVLGMEDPGQLFITGLGCEAGENLTDAMPMHRIAEGEYEVYVKLNAGNSFYFVDAKKEEATHWYVELGKLKEGTEDVVNELDGIYRLNIDFNTASWSEPVKIKEIGYWFCPTNKVEWVLDYVGKGVWEGRGPIEFKQEDWGRDERYKFRVSTISGGKESEEDLGPVNEGEDGKPSGVPTYFNLKVYKEANQWDHKWKFINECDGKDVTLRVMMSGEVYTHEVSL